VRKRIETAAFLLLFLAGGFGFGQDAPAPSAYAETFPFLAGIKQAFESSDRTAYLNHFAPEIRNAEENDYESTKELRLNQVDFSLSNQNAKTEDGEPLYVQAVFQNDEEVLLKTWKLEMALAGERWIVRTKTEIGNTAIFYKLRMPANRVERVSRISVRHADLTATFENAWVFYDNITRLETGLIIIGQGRMQFAPSSDTERHQLDLRYGSGFLERRLSAAFLRFSPSFFGRNITIIPAESKGKAAEPALVDMERARDVFDRYYGDSFSIDNPLIGERLSVLPQGEQAVFELETASGTGFTYMYSPFSEEEIHFRSREPDRLLCYYSPNAGEGDGRRMVISIGGAVDVLRTDIDLEFQPERYYFSARARMELSARGSGADSQRFEFNSALEVIDIIDGEKRQLFFMQDKLRGLLYVRFLQPLEKDQKVVFDVFYRGALEPPPPTSEILASSRWRGQLPGTDGLMYGRAASWYPTLFEEDYFFSRLRISLPLGFECIANGALISKESLADTGGSSYVFETWKPVKGLAFFAGGFREEAKDDDAFPPISVFISEKLRSSRRDLLADAREIVRFYAKIFGPYPYEKLSVIQRAGTSIGGYSPASFILLNEAEKETDGLNVKEIRSPVDLPQYREFIMAHEIAHQWWGQAVTGATYHDQWLSEGLAQYAAIRFLESRYGNAERSELLKKSVSWAKKMSVYGPITLGARLSFLDFQAFQAVVYGKACVALSLLSDLIGEETMDRGLRLFHETYAYRPARTKDFIRSMENASGRSLRDFFRGWFDGYELPNVSVSYRHVKEGEENSLSIVIHQTGALMTFPLEVSWMEDKRSVRKMLTVASAVETFSFPVSVKPTKFRVDPDGRLPGTIR